MSWTYRITTRTTRNDYYLRRKNAYNVNEHVKRGDKVMIVSKDKMPSRKLEIDLTGPDGNVFNLMGIAKRLAKDIYDNKNPNLSKEMVDGLNVLDELTEGKISFETNLGQYICNRMMESDYENALKIFDEWFGEYVILYR